MTRTRAAISSRFQKILERTALTTGDLTAFARHKQTVVDALVARGILVNNVHTMGSFERGSAIRTVSDIDLLVVVKRKEVAWGDGQKSSNRLLEAFRSSLIDRFPSTGIGRDGQAVVIDFGDGSHPVDVVPAFYERQGGPYNHPIFSIPDGAGGWMETSPSSHNKYIQAADQRAASHLIPLAQIFKYWCASRTGGVPISGFHVEMMLSATNIAAGVRTYSQKFFLLLALLTERKCAALNDPVEISGRIAACSTEAKRTQALASVYDAAVHARAAFQAEEREDFQEAWRQWNIVFKDTFPRDGV
jgi:hypothetical protein